MKDTSLLITVLCDGDWVPTLNDLRKEYTLKQCDRSYCQWIWDGRGRHAS